MIMSKILYSKYEMKLLLFLMTVEYMGINMIDREI
jgi:hypothetical protein